MKNFIPSRWTESVERKSFLRTRLAALDAFFFGPPQIVIGVSTQATEAQLAATLRRVHSFQAHGFDVRVQWLVPDELGK